MNNFNTSLFRHILKLVICTMCLAFMHTGISIIFLSNPMDVTSLLMVQEQYQEPLLENDYQLYRRENVHTESTKYTKLPKTERRVSSQHYMKNVRYVRPLIYCNKYEHRLVALINSARPNIQRRQAIRDSWGSSNVLSDNQVCLIFVVGIDNNQLLTVQIEKEKLIKKDILEGKFVDHTHNNTLKSLVGFSWTTSSNSEVPYILLADDTMFINFEILISKGLSSVGNYSNTFWMGNLEVNRRVTRKPDSISYISEETYSGTKLPPFCTKEAGFVLSPLVAAQVVELTAGASFISQIDHFMAVYIHKHHSGNIKIISNKLFSNKKVDACELSVLATAPGMYSIDSHEEYWKNISSFAFLKRCDNPDLALVLSKKVSNRLYFETTLNFIHANEHACVDIENESTELYLIALISSSASNYDRRSAIRRTWGANRMIENVNIRLFFVISVENENSELYNKVVLNEMEMFNDIIQLDFLESFRNLTLKVVAGLKWMTMYCNQAHYLYKGDDDMFVNFKLIIELIQKRIIKEPFYFGQVLERSKIVRRPTSKYFVPVNVYSGEFYPPYCSGGGYIISVEAISAMYKASLKTPLLPIDDVFQGIIAKKVGISPTMIEQFRNNGGPSDHCSLVSSMTLHGFKTKFMLEEVWKNYTKEIPYLCKNEDK